MLPQARLRRPAMAVAATIRVAAGSARPLYRRQSLVPVPVLVLVL